MSRDVPVCNGKLRERLLSRVVHRTDGCWQWTGAKGGSLGYGRLWDGERVRQATHIAYELFRGRVPDGHEIDHLCKNPGCVNPDHLEPVTHQVNCERALVKTHCREGHPLDGENLLVVTRKRGRKERVCRACARDRLARHRAARRAAA